MPQPSLATRMKRFLPRLCALVSLILLVPYVAFAQDSAFRQYGQQDGLTNLSVTALLQDRPGYIWVGTENGLFRHDGTGFELFSSTDGLEDTWVRDMIEDPAGRYRARCLCTRGAAISAGATRRPVALCDRASAHDRAGGKPTVGCR